jgi:hypothetical protein
MQMGWDDTVRIPPMPTYAETYVVAFAHTTTRPGGVQDWMGKISVHQLYSYSRISLFS